MVKKSNGRNQLEAIHITKQLINNIYLVLYYNFNLYWVSYNKVQYFVMKFKFHVRFTVWPGLKKYSVIFNY